MTDSSALTRDLRLLLGKSPDPNASASRQAAWLESKAELLDRLAEHVAAAGRAEVREVAARARAQARQLRGGGSR